MANNQQTSNEVMPLGDALLFYLQMIAVIAAIGAVVVAVNAVLRWLLTRTRIGEMDPDEMVTVAHFSDLEQAQSAHNKLNGGGIKCLIVEEQHSQFRGGGGFHLPPHIEVRAADADRALDILQSDHNNHG